MYNDGDSAVVLRGRSHNLFWVTASKEVANVTKVLVIRLGFTKDSSVGNWSKLESQDSARGQILQLLELYACSFTLRSYF